MDWLKVRAIALPLFLVVTSASSVSRSSTGSVGATDDVGVASSDVSKDQPGLPFCNPTVQQPKRLIFVSTLDGKVSALNVAGGDKQWSIETGPGAMLSSSIHTLELTNNGQWVRMIPSLSGGLYKMNGKTVEAVPISADHLLKSSFRYSDDLVISGGVESRTYGVDVTSGKVLYECSMASCDNQNETNELSGNQGDIVLIQRHTQTVRAVEPRSGIERWNFSVGQHDLKMSVDPAAYCHSLKEKSGDLTFKVIVPDGLVCALDSSGNVVWKHKFEFPVVSAWQVDGGKVKWVDLFGGTRTPEEKLYLPKSPVLYIGMHNKQLYIQESVRLQNKVLESVNRLKHHLIADDNLPSIPWAPVPASPGFLGIEGPKDLLQITDETTSTTGLSVLYASEYVNGKGFYLYAEEEPKILDASREDKICTEDNQNGSTVSNYSEDGESDGFQDTAVEVDEFSEKIIEAPIVIASFWYWWKEVLLTSIIAAIIINLILQRRLISFFYWMAVNESNAQEKSIQSGTNVTSTTTTTTVSSNSSAASPNPSENYVSRYLTDFEQIACLGKGGFGVVFHARNKIDESEYAIKRITLPNKEEAHDRMKREVKALAKLDHQNIVRYFNSWVEDPPFNWQEAQDRCWAQAHNDVMVDLTGHVTPTSETPGTSNLRNRSILKSVYRKATSIFYESNSLKPKFDDPPNRPVAAYDDSSGSSIVFENPKSEDEAADTRQLTSSTSGRKSRAERPASLSLGSSPSYSTPVRRKFLYIQMQLCKRDSLKDWLKATPKRDIGEVLNIFNQILLAVEYVHFQGLIHRDLKPSNIFFSYDGQIKVGDFGLVTAMTDDVNEFRSPLLGRRRTGVVDERHTAHVGTHLYMSPEQVSGKQYDYKVDIYSLGVIFFELLINFNTEMERYKTLEKVRDLVFPPDFNKKHPAEHKLLLMMLSSNPKIRPTTIGIRSREPMVQLQPEGSISQDGHFQLPFRNREPSFTRTRTLTESS